MGLNVVIKTNELRNRHILRWAAIAACILLVFCGVFFGPKLWAGVNHQNSTQNNAMAVLHDYANIFYTDPGSTKIKSKSVLMDYTPQTFFSEWKKLNRIPEQVKLLDTKIDTDGHEVRTSSTAQYVVGKTRILNLTLSKEFLEEGNRAVLIQTLVKTFQDRFSPYQSIHIIVDGKVLNP